MLNLDYLYALMNNSSTILGGDFNAHHPDWNDPSSSNANSCRNGLHIHKLLNNFPAIALLNRYTPTHLRGGVLDLTFTSSDLPLSDWTLHPFLTSDHFATVTALQLSRRSPLPPYPRWNFRKADWCLSSNILEEWAETYSPSPHLDAHEKEIVSALH